MAEAPLAITATLVTSPAEIAAAIDEPMSMLSVLEDTAHLDLTLEEVEALGLVIGDQQGIRGPRGVQGETGPQGDRGPQGLAGISSGALALVSKLSRAPLSAGSVVYFDGAEHCIKATALYPSDATRAVGVVRYAVSAAEQEVSVLVYGEHDDDTWNFVPGGAVFLGPDGLLTAAVDETWAFVRVMGFALTATRVFVDPQLPVRLLGG